MIGKFKILARVKATREDAALRAMTAKREELRRAHLVQDQRKQAVEESEATLGERETAIYQPIMRKPVKHQAIDETKEKVVRLQKTHQCLKDELEMAVQQCLRLAREEEDARLAYQAAQKTREKYDTMLEDMRVEHAMTAERNEEAEIEDLFCKAQSVPL
ncbi:type III secretion system (T3SS) protein YscO [Breoghania corrubedonensis]|uniref:Type III secretion system (T3SS) protein YscO n=1 Tax=Breoghania corrubedonensis TaxID=665038 RepID=A0A2T5UYR5_9HYPH|nr:YscO family type III secretion system apparatus protein [Breoghania corrubedonensis]PTW56646.1 type III secretion system (T3SS) protein YscO [Breoghania corrubedonensis]